MKTFSQILESINSAAREPENYVDSKGKTRTRMVPDKINLTKEELKGGQKKLDHNKNGKIDAQDFHMMRKKKKMEEEAEYNEWDDMTRSELSAAIMAAEEILDMMDDGVTIERWQLSEIITASKSLTDVYINMSADNDDDEEESDDEEE
jgi:hypothetical protein